MEITWEVDDGYAGKGRPQTTIVDDTELGDCDSEEEREELITQCIQDNFEQRISWRETSRSE